MSQSKQMIFDIVDIISETAINCLSDKNSNHTNDKEHIVNFIGLTHEELVSVTTFIIDFLPQHIYLNKYQTVNNHVVGIISKELILFLTQEDKTSPYFQNYLKNFRDEIMNNVINNIYILDK